MRTVAIIGGGFSGVAIAAHLARFGMGDVRAVIVEKSARAGMGVAYGTMRSEHLLNVAAGRMSAFQSDADHLLRWLRASGHAYTATDFIPRSVYGAYLRSLLDDAVRRDVATVRRGRCARIERGPRCWELALEDDTRLTADAVVLAIGNGTPARLRVTSVPGDGPPDPRVIQNPWADLPHGLDPDSRVVIVGTGLTAIDTVLTLDAFGHGGTITAVSRRGLLPRAHASTSMQAMAFSPADLLIGGSLRSVLRAVREACEREVDAGGSWLSVIDSLRPHTAQIWKGWSVKDRRDFCRFLRPFWDVHRHRMAPSIAARIEAHVASGRLQVLRGVVGAIEATHTGVLVTATGTDSSGQPARSIRADLVVNCTGPTTDPSRWKDELVDSLLQSGTARVDAFGLGFETDDDGRVIDREGIAAADLFAIGPLRRPLLWESIAVPEIRLQAAQICEALAGRGIGEQPRSAESSPAR